MEEGYIKFKLYWQQEDSLTECDIEELQANRQAMFQHGFIGWDDDLGVAYGNLSKRDPSKHSEFIISGTQTGGLEMLKEQDFCRVTNFDISKNQVWCKGPIKASSESMTHAAIYSASAHYQAVIHIHHRQMWEHYYNQLPTSSPKAAYGTIEMAKAINDIAKSHLLPPSPLVIMGGHQDGIIGFGANLNQVTEAIFKHFKAIS